MLHREMDAGRATMRAMRVIVLLLLSLAVASAQTIRVGIIGTDTSHAPAFTRILNDSSDPQHIPGAKVVAAFKGGSPDIESSRERIDRFTAELRDKWGVEIVDDIATLCSKVDVVLLESVDGRKHLPQVRTVFEAGKPVFIDKPLAASYADAKEIARLAKQHGVPWWSSSSLRYSPAVADVQVDNVRGAITWGPAPLEATHELDLSWYGIHAVELLYSVMGTGCVRVQRTFTEGADVIVGTWSDGRLGTVRTIRDGQRKYGVLAIGEKETKVSERGSGSYAALLKHVVPFFKDGKPPVPNDETMEIFAFMDAALRSKNAGGMAVALR